MSHTPLHLDDLMIEAVGVTPEYHVRIKNRMDKVDAMAPDMRALVYEYGLTIVDSFITLGVCKARHIAHLINTVRDGSSAYGNGSRGERMRSYVPAGMALVPKEPSAEMIAASMATVANFDVRVTKAEKHRLRLKAAIEAAPSLDRAGSIDRGTG